VRHDVPPESEVDVELAELVVHVHKRVPAEVEHSTHARDDKESKEDKQRKG
jgi:hypothetical protein